MRASLSLPQLADRYLFPGSLRKCTQATLEADYASRGATIHSVTCASGQRVGLLYGAATRAPAVPAEAISGFPHATKTSPRALLYFYGNGSGLEMVPYEFQLFRELGYDVIVAEYVGYGMSSGTPSETGCYEAADAAYDYATTTLGATSDHIVLCGHSLGAAVAIDLAARRPTAGLISVSAFTRLEDEARVAFPWVPVPLLRLVAMGRFDNLRKLPLIRGAIFIGHGTRDDVIPCSMAGRLAEAARGRRSGYGAVTYLPIAYCGHNDIFDSDTLWAGLHAFLTHFDQPASGAEIAADEPADAV